MTSGWTRCIVEVCNRQAICRGMCRGHYTHWRHHGEVPTHALRTDSSFVDRFLARTAPGPGSCVVWTGSTKNGRYGACSYKGRVYRTHVLAYRLFVGEYDPSLVIDHLCRVTLCVNPAHLEPVTQLENVLRGTARAAENARKTHCIRGHDLTDPANVIRRGPGNRWRECVACRHEHNIRSPQGSAMTAPAWWTEACPHCSATLEPHCVSPTCDQLRCSCGCVVTRDGKRWAIGRHCAESRSTA